MTQQRALITVDLQNDFMPGGSLAVPDAHEVIGVANRLQRKFDLVVATQDWHPPDHGSFASNHPGREPGELIELHGLDQVLWPDHCVQGTPGAEFVGSLECHTINEVFRKGTDPAIDSYSGFFDNGHRKSTGLERYLRDAGVETVIVVGVATDYCVKFTVLDALKCGFSAWVVRDACRGVNLQPDDSERALEAMHAAGALIVDSFDV